MSEQNDPQEQDQQHRDEPTGDEEGTEAGERTAEQSQEEIDELEANGVDDLQGTSGVTEVTDKVNRAEGPVL